MDALAAFRLLLVFLTAAALLPVEPSRAQPAATDAAIAAADPEKRREETARELEEIRAAMTLGEKRREELTQEIGQLEKDRATINGTLIETSARARDLARRIDKSEARLSELREQQDAVRQSLKGRRALLAEVIAGLQRMGRNPPPAILVTPEDALSSVRSAILLGSVVPEIRSETQVLIAELEELTRLGKEIDGQRETLSADLKRQAEEEERLNLLLGEKKKMTAQARQELASQSARAAELAARETNLSDLVARLETELSAARDAAEAARKAVEERKAREDLAVAEAREELEKPDFSDMARIAPAVSFEKAMGLLPRPVDGVEIHSFGKRGLAGQDAAGVSIATRAGARITAPADGWVAYAGPFRSYGQLLILNAGDDYHVVLAGMERIDVQLGQFVLAGEPVGAMGSRRIASLETIGVESARPVLYVEFRKDGKSIDPSPWWADTTTRRVADDT